MRPTRWLATAGAVASVSAGVAVAHSQGSETSPVKADFEAALVFASEPRPCAPDHIVVRLRFEGSQTSSDARLTGKLEARARSVVNTTNGYGYVTGRVVIRDPATGRPKFRGTVVGVNAPDEPQPRTEGFLTGRTTGPRPVRLLANFNAVQDPSGAVKGEFGKDTQTGATQDPAVLTNACDGRAERHDDDDDD